MMPEPVLLAALDRLEQIRDTPTTEPQTYIAAVGAILALETLTAMLEREHPCGAQ